MGSIIRIMRTLSLPSSMLPPTRLTVSRSEDTQLSFSIQRTTRQALTTAERESSRTSKTGLPKTLQSLRVEAATDTSKSSERHTILNHELITVNISCLSRKVK